MSGNVYEWCWDKFSAISSSRAYRGGGWNTSASLCVVSSSRDFNYPYGQYGTFGFRLVRKAPAP